MIRGVFLFPRAEDFVQSLFCTAPRRGISLSLSAPQSLPNDNRTRGYNVREANRINADVTHTEYIVRDKNLLGMAGGNIAAGPFESARVRPRIRCFMLPAPARAYARHAHHASVRSPSLVLYALYATYMI